MEGIRVKWARAEVVQQGSQSLSRTKGTHMRVGGGPLECQSPSGVRKASGWGQPNRLSQPSGVRRCLCGSGPGQEEEGTCTEGRGGASLGSDSDENLTTYTALVTQAHIL